MRDESRLTGWLLIGIPGLIWGASFLFIAEGLEAVGPAGVTFIRILVGFLTLGLFPGAWKKIPRADWGAVALLGLVWLAFPLSMFPLAEQHVSSAVTGMLNSATPLFVAIIASLLAQRLPGRGILTGLAVGILGAVLMALPSIGEGRSSAWGIGLILAALLSYGIALNLARPLQQRYGALPVIWRAQSVGLLLTAPLGIPDLRGAHWTLGPALSLLALGALGTGVAFVITTYAAGKIGATRASSTAFLFPPVALLLGVLVRHEHVAPLAVLGGAVCVTGAWLMNRAQRAAPPAPAAPALPAEPAAWPRRQPGVV
jgi:drug/metabolite transporter (DMT)-like permease